ncbi:MAG: response regulator [Verrucomicrobia bacterium]|nr:response regulator [Verrucomicrobiota bacterium]
MEGQNEAILNALDDAIVSLDPQRRVVFLNEAAAALFGCPRGQVTGQPLEECPVLAEVWRRLKIGELGLSASAPRAVRRLDAAPGQRPGVPLEACISQTWVAGQSHVTVWFRDLSVQRRMEDAVYQARKHQAVGALASGIAHDFNNILTAVISQIDLALHSPECPESLRANLCYAETSARRGAELVAKLQLFSRQATSKLIALDLGDVVDKVVFVLRHTIDPRIEIRWDPPAQRVWPVKADTSLLMQALINLGLNARDAMPAGGQLRLALANVTTAPVEARPPRKAGDFVKLTVADTGQGMPPETLARLFDPYFTTKDIRQGPGLGLSITFSVVAEHGGWIEAESRVGEGSTYHVFLPRTREAPVAVAPSDSAALATQTLEGRERILVVDDEEAVRMVIRAVLSYRGYEVLEAVDGEDAIRQYQAARPPVNLVLMDLHMPRMNGRDALERIRQRDPHVRAILLSGGLQEPEPDTVAQVEGVRFLQKPFDNPQLVAVVRETLDAPPP